MSASTTWTVDGIKLVGWPISTDLDYATRPASGTSNGWDSDSTVNIPTIVTTTTGVQFITSAGNANQVFRRIKFFQNSATTTTAVSILNSPEFRYCTLTSLGATAGIRTVTMTAPTVGLGPTFYNCTLDGQGTQGPISTVATTFAPQFFDCAFTKTVTSAANAATSGSVAQAGLFVRCTFTDAVTTALNNFLSIASSTAASLVVMIDCTMKVDGANNSTFAAGKTFTIASPAMIRNMSYTGGTGVDILTTNPGFPVHFSTFTQTRTCTNAGINLTIACEVYAANVTFFPSPTSDIITLTGAWIALRNATFASTLPITGITQPGVVSLDHNGVTGVWALFGERGQMITSVANRTGGETFSIRLSMADGSLPEIVPIEVASPGTDATYVSLVSGTNNVTLYGAHKNFGGTPPTQEDFWMELEYYDLAAPSSHVVTLSSKTGLSTALTTDTSTWNNDAGLTVFKIVLTVVTGQACIVPVRIKFQKFVPGGYLLFDPRIVVS